MIKSWLITTQTPFFGTEQYYKAYAEDKDKLSNWLYTNWFDVECQRLYDSYSYLSEDEWESEYKENSENYPDYESFMNDKYEELCQNCSIDIEEYSEEDFAYITSEDGFVEIIYDERK